MNTDINANEVKGFTKIPNNLIESLVKTKLTGSELIVFLIICRQTYGWHKKYIALSGSRVSKFSYFPTSYVFRILNRLEDKGLILIARGGRGSINIINIIEDTSIWSVNLRKPKNYISQDTTSSISQEHSSDIPQDTHKRNTDKELLERNMQQLRQRIVDLHLKRP